MSLTSSCCTRLKTESVMWLKQARDVSNPEAAQMNNVILCNPKLLSDHLGRNIRSVFV